MKKVPYLVVTPLFAIASFFNILQAEAPSERLDENEIEMIQENETLSYQAEVISMAAAQKDVEKLAKEAVTLCYNAYKTNYDNAVAQDLEHLIKIGAYNGNAKHLTIIRHANSFAENIINQIGTITPKLSHQEKQVFWNAAEGEVNNVLIAFCKGRGCADAYIGELTKHISNVIQMKKTFG